MVKKKTQFTHQYHPRTFGKEAENVIKALGWTRLHCAVFNQQYDSKDKKTISKLSQRSTYSRIKGLTQEVKAPVDQTDIFGLTPLHIAAVSQNFEILLRLISNGADVNCRDANGWTPLHFAVLLGERRLAIIWNSAAAEKADPTAIAPLIYPKRYTQDGKLRYDTGSMNLPGALTFAARSPVAAVNMTEWLLSQGADPDAANIDGISPLDQAYMQAYMTKYAEKLTVRQHTISNPHYKREIADKVFGYLWHASMQSRDPWASVALSASKGYEVQVYGLLKNALFTKPKLPAMGAQDQFQTRVYPYNDVFEEKTALYWACERGNHAMAEFLIEFGAKADSNLNRSDNRFIPLHLAIEMKDIQMVNLMLTNVDNHLVKNEYGQTTYEVVSTQSGRQMDDMKLAILGCFNEGTFTYNYKPTNIRQKILIPREMNLNPRSESAFARYLYLLAEQGDEKLWEYTIAQEWRSKRSSPFDFQDINRMFPKRNSKLDTTAMAVAAERGHIQLAERIFQITHLGKSLQDSKVPLKRYILVNLLLFDPQNTSYCDYAGRAALTAALYQQKPFENIDLLMKKSISTRQGFATYFLSLHCQPSEVAAAQQTQSDKEFVDIVSKIGETLMEPTQLVLLDRDLKKVFEEPDGYKQKELFEQFKVRGAPAAHIAREYVIEAIKERNEDKALAIFSYLIPFFNTKKKINAASRLKIKYKLSHPDMDSKLQPFINSIHSYVDMEFDIFPTQALFSPKLTSALLNEGIGYSDIYFLSIKAISRDFPASLKIIKEFVVKKKIPIELALHNSKKKSLYDFANKDVDEVFKDYIDGKLGIPGNRKGRTSKYHRFW